MKTLCLKGKVFAGKGEGKEFLQLDWVKKQITEKLGFAPYLGTLNIKLTKQSTKLRRLLETAKAIEVSPANGFCHGKCFKAYLMDLKCAIVLPEIVNYPENVIEIVAPVNLRENFHLKDGDIVEVKVFL